MKADRRTRLGDVLADPRGEAALRQTFPQLFLAPEIAENIRKILVGPMLDYANLPDAAASDFLRQISEVELLDRIEPPAIEPDPEYESDDVPRASAKVVSGDRGEYGVTFEIVLDGPSHGNPFVDVDVWADFRDSDGNAIRVGGFYDGNGRYVIRFLAPRPGIWHYVTGSTARSLSDIEGRVEIAPSERRGPVRVEGEHFSYSDGSAYVPVGTTLYAWTHQEEAREEDTLSTLADSPFNKVRMCVLPKHYDFNTDEPPRHPFPPTTDGGWDTTRFDADFFRHLERRIADLDALGIEADVILFHPYDRWGYEDMGKAADDRYATYVVRRLAGLPNVWWSLANEYDLMAAKRDDDWDRIGRLVQREDHAAHPLSIHNGPILYDFSAEWITHCSIQKVGAESPIPQIERWRASWNKPIVIDEIGYEGDIGWEWGSLSAQELVHRAWQVAVRGGYMTHGETYLNPEMRLWWAAGGRLVGESPARIALLASLAADSPNGRLEALPGYSHVKSAGVAGSYELHYLDHFQPKQLTFAWPEGRTAYVDIIDTWELTVDHVSKPFVGTFSIELPVKPGLAIRICESR
jgi:hypothetical protein